MLSELLRAARAALTVPLTPAPAKGLSPAAIYRFQPAEADGAHARGHFTVRVFHTSPEAAFLEIRRLRRALVSDGDLGRVGVGADALRIYETKEGGAFGYVRDTSLCYVQAGFFVEGRA